MPENWYPLPIQLEAHEEAVTVPAEYAAPVSIRVEPSVQHPMYPLALAFAVEKGSVNAVDEVFHTSAAPLPPQVCLLLPEQVVLQEVRWTSWEGMTLPQVHSSTGQHGLCVRDENSLPPLIPANWYPWFLHQ